MNTLETPLTRIDGENAGSDAVLPQSQELVREIAACLPALPVLQTQLKQAVQTVEQSVVEVCGTFLSIAQQARNAVAAPSGDSERDGSIATMLKSCSQAFDRLLLHIEKSSDLVNATSDRIGEFSAGMHQVTELLGKIDDLARDVYVVALNGTIEASRAGEHGKTFSVVAQHTRQLAERARLTSNEIGEIVQRVLQKTTDTAKTLELQVAEDRTCVEASRQQASQAVQQLSTAHSQLNTAMQQSVAANNELAASISRAVTTMQFQDAVAQRIGHVAATLGEMQESLSDKLVQLGDEQPAASSHWLDRMSSQYVMAAERNAAAVATHTSTQPTQASDLGDNIELF